ncbi:hypothetical protein H7198_06110 [Fructobacillus sp. CRL 2054]|nr:hypothetical protein [Fructobacillus sp. CRL 2054]MDD9139175.1 hypothetical protein [Fructobacillus sp. CRL 2054]
MKMNSKQKWLIAISVIVYVAIIGLHIIDANDPSSVNYKGGQTAKKGSN